MKTVLKLLAAFALASLSTVLFVQASRTAKEVKLTVENETRHCGVLRQGQTVPIEFNLLNQSSEPIKILEVMSLLHPHGHFTERNGSACGGQHQNTCLIRCTWLARTHLDKPDCSLPRFVSIPIQLLEFVDPRRSRTRLRRFERTARFSNPAMFDANCFFEATVDGPPQNRKSHVRSPGFRDQSHCPGSRTTCVVGRGDARSRAAQNRSPDWHRRIKNPHR